MLSELKSALMHFTVTFLCYIGVLWDYIPVQKM